jgi:predicted amidophosphoribosyltransferase
MDRTAAEFDTCRLCAAPTPPGTRCCFCCAALARQLGMPPAPTVAVASYRIGDPLHRLLRGYKDAPVAEVRDACTRRLAALLGGWLAADPGRLRHRVGEWGPVVAVPPSHRPGPAPVDRLVAAAPELAGSHRAGALVRGPAPLDHLQADRRGFAVDPAALTGPRGPVLVVDDSLTTGARAQSAVAALRLAGREVAGVLAVGRAVSPTATPWQRAWWEGVAALPGPRGG